MTRAALISAVLMAWASMAGHAFERVQCMDQPGGSVYIFKRAPERHNSLDVRIYHGWQFSEHSLPGLPIGIDDDFLNARYRTRTAEARERAIAAFSPLERLIFNMDIVFHHRFDDCELGEERVRCRESRPIKVGREWIFDVEFFFDTRYPGGMRPEAVYTVGIRGAFAQIGLEISSGRRYFNDGRTSECLYLRQDGW